MKKIFCLWKIILFNKIRNLRNCRKALKGKPLTMISSNPFPCSILWIKTRTIKAPQLRVLKCNPWEICFLKLRKTTFPEITRVVKTSQQPVRFTAYSLKCAGFSQRASLNFTSIRNTKIRKSPLLLFPSLLLLSIFLTTLDYTALFALLKFWFLKANQRLLKSPGSIPRILVFM